MSVVRVKKNRNVPFTIVSNDMLKDQSISLKAKGFITYCMSFKDNWKFNVRHLESILKEGEKAIYAVIKECIEAGYCFRVQEKGEAGRWLKPELYISDSKEEIEILKKEVPLSCFGDAVNREPENRRLTNTKDTSYLKKNNNNKEEEPVVVVFSDKEKEDLLSGLDLSDTAYANAMSYTVEEVATAVKVIEGMDNIENVSGTLTAALRDKWQPKRTKAEADKETKEEWLEKEKLRLMKENESYLLELEALYKKYTGKLTQDWDIIKVDNRYVMKRPIYPGDRALEAVESDISWARNICERFAKPV